MTPRWTAARKNSVLKEIATNPVRKREIMAQHGISTPELGGGCDALKLMANAVCE